MTDREGFRMTPNSMFKIAGRPVCHREFLIMIIVQLIRREHVSSVLLFEDKEKLSFDNSIV